MSALDRLSGGATYTEKVITALKKQGLIRTFYRDHMRGLRLTARAKDLLLEDNPQRFSFCFEGHSDTNHPHGEPARRERMHRIAETLLTMMNAGVSVFRDERPPIFLPSHAGSELVSLPAFYHSREIQEMGERAVKVKGSRSVGTLLTEREVFNVYCLDVSLIKWDYRSEIRLKTLMLTYLCLEHFPHRYHGDHSIDDKVKGLVFGSTMETAYEILQNKRKNHFILDDNYNSFHFLTGDRDGETVLKLLCAPDRMEALNTLLMHDLQPLTRFYNMIFDAFTENGDPVLFAYTCDLKSIKSFAWGLDYFQQHGVLYCFQFQAEVLKRYCGEWADVVIMDIDAVRRIYLDE